MTKLGALLGEAFYDSAPTWEQLAPIAEVGLAALIAVVGAAWALRKYWQERRSEAEDRLLLERERLEQIRREEDNRRAERASELVLELGRSDDMASRWLTASALTLYSKEITPILISALGHAEPQMASALSTALLAIGAPALDPLIRANRVASTMARVRPAHDDASRPALLDSSGQLLANSRAVLANILVLHLGSEERAKLDLSDVDLEGSTFAGSDLHRICLRKAIVDRCDFTKAKLQESNFRGASAADAVFAHANALRADFTGLKGPVTMIRMRAKQADFTNAQLARSRLDAADLSDATFERANLSNAVLNGARIRGATLSHCGLHDLEAHHLKLSHAHLSHCELGRANLREATFGKATFNTCKINGADFTKARGSSAELVNCNLGGSNFTDANLCDVVFRRCILGGASFDGADLTGAVFDSCDLIGIRWASLDLSGVTFRGVQEFRPSDLGDVTDTWLGATFEGDSTSLREALAAGNDAS